MSIRTDIPWPNISGSSTKIIRDGCNSSYNYSEFSGLGTSAFNFTRISNENSCHDYNYSYGYNNYSHLNNYYGQGYFPGGCSNQFTKIMSGIATFFAGFQLFNSIGNLFFGGNRTTSTGNMYEQGNATAGDNTVYVEKTIKKFVKQDNGSIKIIETKQKVKSPDGSNKPILEIVNEAGVKLNENNEVVFETKTETKTQTRKNKTTGKMEKFEVTTTSKVPVFEETKTSSDASDKLKDIKKLTDTEIKSMTDEQKKEKVTQVAKDCGCTKEQAAEALGLPKKERKPTAPPQPPPEAKA